MLAKLTNENQIILPSSITQEVGNAKYFDIKVEIGQIILIPVEISPTDEIRAKLAKLDLSMQDVEDAVAWVRQTTVD